MAQSLSPEPQNNPFARPHPVLALFREHPALAVSFGYLAASALGMLFSRRYYRRFDIDFFNYAEIGDFLMAALREPIMFLLTLGAVGVVWLMRTQGRFEWRHFSRKPPRSWLARVYFRSSRPFWGNHWAESAILVLYAYLFISLYGDWKAEQFLAAPGPDDRGLWMQTPESRDRVSLLGTTSRFVFAYDRASGSVSIVPHENLLRLLVEPAADGPDDDAGAAPVPAP